MTRAPPRELFGRLRGRGKRIAQAARESGAQAVTGTLHSTDAAMDVVLRRVRAAVEQRDIQLAAT